MPTPDEIYPYTIEGEKQRRAARSLFDKVQIVSREDCPPDVMVLYDENTGDYVVCKMKEA